MRTFKTVLAYSAYIVAFTLLLPFLVLRLLWRSRLAPKYKERILERFGSIAIQPDINGIWVHAVSVGETIAAEPVIRALQARYPEKSIVVTTTTPTGSEHVKSIFGDTVEHVYAPYDWPLCVWLFIRRVKPALVIVMETELWPVSIGLCHLMRIPVLLANARLSEKSSNGYKKLCWLIEPALRHLWIAAQHENDSERFIALGANTNQVQVTGSLKFDLQLSDTDREQALSMRAEMSVGSDIAESLRFIWIAASTHRGEDEQILRAHQQVLLQSPQTLLVLVPRHPERFDEVAELIANMEMQFSRRSTADPFSRGSQILLADTMGELTMLYGIADIAFVGGSLIPVGGHNYIEPAAWGLPILSGPYRHNFLAIASQLEAEGVLKTVRNSHDIAMSIMDIIKNPRNARIAGNAGVSLINKNRGATEKTLSFIENRLLEKKS